MRRARRTGLNLAARSAPRLPGTPVLYGYSRHVLPPPPSWASTHRIVTGYWTLPADQSFWAARVHALGVGPPANPRRRLTADRVAAALLVLTRDRRMRARATRLGALIREEDGFGAAVGHIVRVHEQTRQQRTH